MDPLPSPLRGSPGMTDIQTVAVFKQALSMIVIVVIKSC
jgi:hypothetical protein